MSPPLLPRYYRRQQEREDRAAVDKAVAESVDVVPETVARATLPGDNRRLRGIPICALGVSGVSPGTDPLSALLSSERMR